MKNKTILIIDNEQFILKKAQNILTKENLPVKITSKLKEAKEYFASGNIGLIIFSRAAIDFKDKEFLQDICNYEHLKKIPIMVMLNEEEIKEAVNLLKMGANDYILKPFRPKELIYRVLTILSKGKEEPLPTSNLSYKYKLEDMSLIEIVKICEINNFSGIIKINDKGKEYLIEFRLGNITSIQAPSSKQDEAWEKVLYLNQGSLEIEQEPPSFWRAEKTNLKLQENTSSDQSNSPSKEPEISSSKKESKRLPMGRISSLKIDERQFQIQTEVHTGAKPSITTLIICEGQIIKKIERKWTPLTGQKDEISKEQGKINEHHDTIVASLQKLWPLTKKQHELIADLLLKAVKLLANFARQAVGRNLSLHYLKTSHSNLLKKFPELSAFSIEDEGKISIVHFDTSQDQKIKNGVYQWLSTFEEKCHPFSPLFKAKDIRNLTKSLEFQLEWINFYPTNK